jgi:FkbM family methyltransferase
MKNTLKSFLSPQHRNKLRSLMPALACRKTTYSQCGEDLLISLALNFVSPHRPRSYIDIGANHPFLMSNSFLMYQNGGAGTLVEPDPRFARILRARRPRDIVIQAGVRISDSSRGEFYVLDAPTLSTFSRDEMLKCVADGHRLLETVEVDMVDINQVLESSGHVDLMSLDTEGADGEILEQVDWAKHRPTCVCIETLTYEKKQRPRKKKEIIAAMINRGYFMFADTYINSVFVDLRQWSDETDGVTL